MDPHVDIPVANKTSQRDAHLLLTMTLYLYKILWSIFLKPRPKLKTSNTLNKKSHETESKAVQKSIKRSIPGIFSFSV